MNKQEVRMNAIPASCIGYTMDFPLVKKQPSPY